MIYDNKVKFNEVQHELDKENRWMPRPKPYVLDMDRIIGYGNGYIELSETRVLVEEDHDQITNILHAKLREKANFENYLREVEKMGIDPNPEEAA